MLKGSIVALMTPLFNGKIDIPPLKELIELHVTSGTSGIVVCGSTGGGGLLSEENREVMTKQSIEAAGSRIPIIVGCGGISARAALEQVLKAQNLGADYALVACPYYCKPTQEGIYEHYKHIHDNSDIPLIVYNVPSRTMVSISIETALKIAELPRMVAFKDSVEDLSRVTILKEKLGNSFSLLCGEDHMFVGYLAHGGDGIISVTANVVPHMYKKMYELWQNKETDELLKLNMVTTRLSRALFRESNPIPLKYAMSLISDCKNELIIPLLPASKETEDEIKFILKELQLIKTSNAQVSNL